MNWKKTLFLAIGGMVLLVAAGAIIFSPTQRPMETVTLSVGSQFSYQTEVEDLAGKRNTLEQLKGKVVLINFWASWCAPCLREMPALYKLQQKWRGKGLVVLGISMDSDAAAGEQSLRRVAGQAPFEIFKGQDSAISSLFPIEGLPYSVIIDKVGKVSYAQAGEVDWAKADVLKWIEKLL